MRRAELGILVDGGNHFIVEGPRPGREEALELARKWSVIQIGAPPRTPGWTIINKAFREDLQWAVVVPSHEAHSAAVVQLLNELTARKVDVNYL